jgi:metallo-beta-lactamase family protein
MITAGEATLSFSGTKDVIDVLLYDSARLQVDDANRANRKGYTKHKPARPLFDEADVVKVIQRLRVVEFGAVFAPAPGISARFTRAGHILGAAVVQLIPCASSVTRWVSGRKSR